MAEDVTPEPWVDMKAVCEHLSCSPPTVKKMVKRGEIPAFRIRNGARTFMRFRLSAIDAAMLRAMEEPAADK